MNKKQYNNVIDYTLKHETSAQTDDSLAMARAVFNNMGVALPQGDIKTVYETIKTDNYMGWKACTMQEVQAAADNGTAAIGISEDRIVVISESEEIFGPHPIYDLWTILDMIGIALEIVKIAFPVPSFFSEIHEIAKTVVQVLSTSEADVRSEFASYAVNSLIGIAFENTKLEWAYNFISFYDSVDEIVSDISARPNYYRQILNYCAYDTDFDVYIKLRNGDRYKINQICNTINN